MEPSELNIDVASVAREALADRKPEEDLDEAILRSCKKLYGDAGVTAFQAVESAATALAQREDGDREKVLRRIADGKASVNVVTTLRITRKGSTTSLEDLPPEMRAEVEKALASGKSGNIAISQVVNRNMAVSGGEKKRSFWSRLFGN
jgi:hypothetical protein